MTGHVGPRTWQKLREGHLQRLEEDSLLPLVRSFDDNVDIDVAMLQQKLQVTTLALPGLERGRPPLRWRCLSPEMASPLP